MKLLPCTLMTVLLVTGCNDSTDKVTAPAADSPNGGDAVDLDKMAAGAVSQAAYAPRCVQLTYVSETGVIRTAKGGNDCSVCGSGRPVSVTAAIWNGAAGNNVIGRARCASRSGSTIVTGPAVAVDPSGGLFGVGSNVGTQVSGVPGCGLSSTVTNLLNRSNRLVTCVWQ
jgi:hypothetical protein